MKSRLLSIVALFGMYTSVSVAQTFSQNAVGYHTIHTCPDAYFMIANSFHNGGDELNRVLPLPDWADGTTILKWDPATQSYRDGIHWVGEAKSWYSPSDPDPRFHAGEGAFVQTVSNGVFTSMPITFVGEVPSGRLCQTLPRGLNYSIWAPPLGHGAEALGPLQDGDTIQFYTCGAPAGWRIFQYVEDLGQWFCPDCPSLDAPQFRPGEAAFVQLNGPARNICSWPPCFTCLDGETAQSATSESGIILWNPEKNGSTFTFSFSSQTNVLYQVQYTTAVPSGPWENLGATIRANESSTLVVDTNAVTALKLYRVLRPQ
jgi:hypothetical protein